MDALPALLLSRRAAMLGGAVPARLAWPGAQGAFPASDQKEPEMSYSDAAGGAEMEACAADVAAPTDALDLKGAIPIGHATGGGEAARCVSRASPAGCRSWC